MGNVAVNPCDSGPCQNGGTCTATHDGYTCQCTDEFTGDQCEQGKWGYITLNCHYKYSNSFSLISPNKEHDGDHESILHSQRRRVFPKYLVSAPSVHRMPWGAW